MYTKNGKIVLEPADIPCRNLTTVPDQAGGPAGCFSPSCKLIMELAFDEPVFDIGNCKPSCIGYQREAVAECEKHGQYIASHGCLLCDVEGGKKNV